MLADPRAEALVSNFAGQWLQLRNLQQSSPNLMEFPEFDDGLRQGFRRETELLFASLLREQRSVLDLLQADYTFVNERLARHYGIRGVTGSHFRRVAAPDESRRGLLGHGSILLVTSHPNRTSPVKRGKWVLETLLGLPPPPPAAERAAARRDQGARRPLTMKERMEEHRRNPACANCHRLMDPIGLALENFDGVGGWRSRESGVAHRLRHASSLTAPPSTASSILRRAVLRRPEVFVRTVTENLLTYALGRELGRRRHADGPRRHAHGRAAGLSPFRSRGRASRPARRSPCGWRLKPRRRGWPPAPAEGETRTDVHHQDLSCRDARSCAEWASRWRCRCSMRWFRRSARSGPRARRAGLARSTCPTASCSSQWVPQSTGAGFEFTPILKPLEPYRDKLDARDRPDRRPDRAERRARRGPGVLPDRQRPAEADRGFRRARRRHHRPGDRQGDRPGHAVPVARDRHRRLQHVDRRVRHRLQLHLHEHDRVGRARRRRCRWKPTRGWCSSGCSAAPAPPRSGWRGCRRTAASSTASLQTVDSFSERPRRPRPDVLSDYLENVREIERRIGSAEDQAQPPPGRGRGAGGTARGIRRARGPACST